MFKKSGKMYMAEGVYIYRTYLLILQTVHDPKPLSGVRVSCQPVSDDGICGLFSLLNPHRYNRRSINK